LCKNAILIFLLHLAGQTEKSVGKRCAPTGLRHGAHVTHISQISCPIS